MAKRPKPGATRERATDRQLHDQEVLRANRELAAYFKGRRTEREARAALKTIKAFVRDRERQDAKARPPLPAAAISMPRVGSSRKTSSKDRGKTRHKSLHTSAHNTAPVTTPPDAIKNPKAGSSD